MFHAFGRNSVSTALQDIYKKHGMSSKGAMLSSCVKFGDTIPQPSYRPGDRIQILGDDGNVYEGNVSAESFFEDPAMGWETMIRIDGDETTYRIAESRLKLVSAGPLERYQDVGGEAATPEMVEEEEKLKFMLEETPERPEYVLPSDSRADVARYLANQPPFEKGERILAPRRVGGIPELPGVVKDLQWADNTEQWIVFFELTDYPGQIFHLPSSGLAMDFGPSEEYVDYEPEKWWPRRRK